jgi:hypothetical protein
VSGHDFQSWRKSRKNRWALAPEELFLRCRTIDEIAPGMCPKLLAPHHIDNLEAAILSDTVKDEVNDDSNHCLPRLIPG